MNSLVGLHITDVRVADPLLDLTVELSDGTLLEVFCDRTDESGNYCICYEREYWSVKIDKEGEAWLEYEDGHEGLPT